MGLRPKTARRLALVAGLLTIVVIGGLAVLTLPRWQRTRQIGAFKRQGLVAHEAGQHHEAVKLLGKHTRSMGEENTDPAVLLGLARSTAKAEARRNNHVKAAIVHYRAYLRYVPDDLDARRELLGLLVRDQRWGDAVEMAERIGRDQSEGPAVTDLQPVRDELTARVNLDPEDERIPDLRAVLLAAQPPAFEDVWGTYMYLVQERDDEDGADAVLDRYLSEWPDELGARALEIMGPRPLDPNEPASTLSQRPVADVIGDFTALLGLDADVSTPGSLVIVDKGLGSMLAGFFDIIGRTDLASEVLSQSLEGSEAHKNTNSLARRLFWFGQNEALFNLEIDAGHREALCDTLGYQALAALETGDEERAGVLQRELESLGHHFKAKAWSDMLTAKGAYDAQDYPAARAAINEAIERHEEEPTFRLLLGDVQSELGFNAEALVAWEQAEFPAGSVPWSAPRIRRITMLLTTNRMLNASELMDEAMAQRRFQSDLGLLQLDLRVRSSLARQGLIPATEAAQAAERGERIRSLLSEQDLSEIDLSLATLYAVLDEPEEAAKALARVLDSDSAQRLMTEVLETDQRYGLGLARSLGQPDLPETIEDPEAALRLTLTYTEASGRRQAAAIAGVDPERQARIDRSLALIDRGIRAADPGTRPGWLLTRAQYLDVFRTDEAATAWRTAIEADPNNLVLLNRAVQSDALGTDLAFVDATIDRIRELTSSQGRTLPALLRLARAQAVFGTEPDRARREVAIGIARSVVAAEPRNTRARLVLGRILAADCSPVHTDPGDRFEPDLRGAIEQFQNIAGQIRGNEAVGYYFEIIDLANRLGDRQRVQRAVRDAIGIMDRDAASIRRLAQAIRASGDRAGAARALESWFDQATGDERVRTGFVLVETYEMIGDGAGSARVLDALAAADGLTLDDLILLTTRMTQNGMQDRVDALLADPARIGLDEPDALIVRANLIASFSPIDEATTRLDSLTEAAPDNIEIWRLLIQSLLDADRVDEANERIARAERANPGDDTIAFLRASASGDLGALARLTLTDPTTPEYLRRALEEVQAFESTREGMKADDQLAALRLLTTRFPRLAPVLNYTIVEREAIGEAMVELREDAIAAARSFPNQPALLRVATRVSLATGAHEDAAEFAATWRGLVDGSRLEPDLYAAEAAQLIGRDDRAIALLEPYIDGAIATPTEPLNAAAMVVHGASSMRSGEMTAVRSRYEPIAADDPGFRAAVWIVLASRWTPSPSDAFAWIEAAERWGMPGQEGLLTQAWLEAAERFETSRAPMLERAIGAADRAIAADATKPLFYAQRAGALRILGLMGPESGRNWMAAAESAYVDADRADPANLNMLFSAGRCADDDQRPSDAERHYAELLARPGCTGMFAAAVRNNIAMSIVRQRDTDPDRLEQARQLVDGALAERVIPAFQSTRGWVRYLSGDPTGAAEDFRQYTQNSSDNPLGWAGLALALRGEGSAPSVESRGHWSRALGLGLQDAFALDIGVESGFSDE